MEKCRETGSNQPMLRCEQPVAKDEHKVPGICSPFTGDFVWSPPATTRPHGVQGSAQTQPQQGSLLPGPWPQRHRQGNLWHSLLVLPCKRGRAPSLFFFFNDRKINARKAAALPVSSCLAPSPQDDAFRELRRRAALPSSQKPPRKETPSSSSGPLCPAEGALRNS